MRRNEQLIQPFSDRLVCRLQITDNFTASYSRTVNKLPLVYRVYMIYDMFVCFVATRAVFAGGSELEPVEAIADRPAA